ncbi:5-formyltetrahydrofolate cyclo-ligase [Paenibacillus shirakamiensis]|nr:5-formyltetrahydrofolate cyclo-ligase [Paenibacillus shirakamiensis]
MKENKQELRQQMLAVRAAVSKASRAEQAEVASRWIEQGLLAPMRQRKGRNLHLAMYLAFRDEAPTTSLLQMCWSRGDRIWVPRVHRATSTFTLHEIASMKDIVSGSWGIPEPKEHCPIWQPEQQDLDFMLLPGLAFDRNGGRLGFGGGYYDRFLEHNIVHPPSVNDRMILGSLALKEQIVPRIPMEEHDVKLDVLITASGLTYI